MPYAGFLGATFAARDVDGAVEFTVITRWASLEAIRGFAGTAIEPRRGASPARVATLRDHDKTVDHLTVIDGIAMQSLPDAWQAARHSCRAPVPQAGKPRSGSSRPRVGVRPTLTTPAKRSRLRATGRRLTCARLA